MVMNATMEKFGAPDTMARDFEHWAVLLRPQQVTLGSLVLVCKEAAGAFSELSPGAFAELGQVVGQTERALADVFRFDRINYLMLMMVDPDVHFHVVPRYAHQREHGDQVFHDYSWPGPPDLGQVNPTTAELNRSILASICSAWPQA